MLRHSVGCLLLLLVLPALTWGQDRKGVEFFEAKIRPVLVKHCYECHAEDSKEIGGELLLDTRAGTRRGGESGAAVTPGNPAQSLILSALAYNEFEMPPAGQLPATVLSDFRKWIKMGAPDPRKGGVKAKPASTAETAGPGKLWSLQPLAAAKPPVVKHSSWVESDIDRFVLARQEAAGIEPLEDAKPLALLRRLTFALTGLPPTVDQIDAFSKDNSPQAYAALVDSLLASPQYAERWARHWLDIARFAESNGKDRDVLMPHAWRYRNYVIDAFNKDVPYNRFVTEQIAGDLLPADSPTERDRLNIATGFLAVGSKSFTSSFQMDLVDDQIDVVSRSVLGLTVSCARCHDHKYDPVPTRDYYAMAGIFRSTDTKFGGGLKRGKNAETLARQLIALESFKPPKSNEAKAEKAKPADDVASRNKQIKELTQRRTALNKSIRKLTSMLPADWRKLRQPLKQKDRRTPAEQKQLDQIETLMKSQQDARALLMQIRKLQAADKKKGRLNGGNAAPAGAFAVGVQEEPKPADCRIHIRGDAKNQGDAVPRGFLSCINIPGVDEIDSQASGRRELAAWLTHPQNPLTPRVMANRVWLHLMGEGLVATPDNFGVNAVEPTHPELLDYLAREFQTEGWSVKRLIRKIVMSHAYRVAARDDAPRSEVDPENKLLWRHPRERLEAECIRDAMLAASGELKLERPQASAVAEIGEGEVGRGIDIAPLSAPFPHRSVYLPIIRGIVPPVLKTFDFPEPSNVQGRRDVTTVPSQSLFLMNNKFAIQQAQAFADRVLNASTREEERIQFAFKAALSRPASKTETENAVNYLKNVRQGGGLDEQQAWTTFCQALFASAEFRYVE